MRYCSLYAGDAYSMNVRNAYSMLRKSQWSSLRSDRRLRMTILEPQIFKKQILQHQILFTKENLEAFLGY